MYNFVYATPWYVEHSLRHTFTNVSVCSIVNEIQDFLPPNTSPQCLRGQFHHINCVIQPIYPGFIGLCASTDAEARAQKPAAFPPFRKKNISRIHDNTRASQLSSYHKNFPLPSRVSHAMFGITMLCGRTLWHTRSHGLVQKIKVIRNWKELNVRGQVW